MSTPDMTQWPIIPPVMIPDNPLGIKPGFYTRRDLAALLTRYAGWPERIRFIAKCMEET